MALQGISDNVTIIDESLLENDPYDPKEIIFPNDPAAKIETWCKVTQSVRIDKHSPFLDYLDDLGVRL